MMKLNKIALTMCCAAGMSLTTQASLIRTDNTIPQLNHDKQSSVSFNDWLDSQALQRNTTDQIIVTLHSTADLEALQMVASGSSSRKDGAATSLQKSATMSAKGRQILQELSASARVPLSFAESIDSKHAVFKLDQEMHLKDVENIASALTRSAKVAEAEPDPKRWAMSQTTPFGFFDVQADQLSDAAASNMTVCVVDSGYDRTHPDLASNNHNGTNDAGTGNWYEAGGSHGTHVAGTIAAINNQQGIQGVLPNAKVNLHIIKVFSAAGWAYSSSLVSAVDQCRTAGAKVVNMSLGGDRSSNFERAGMKSLEDSGMLLVAAAGNAGNSVLSYPASYDSVMSVASVDEMGSHASYSQFTPQVEIAGPGTAVLSTVARGDGLQGYITYNGKTAGDDRVSPHTRLVPSNGSWTSIESHTGTVTGPLAACTLTNDAYNCGDMSGKICIAERIQNSKPRDYPEYKTVNACLNAGAAGIIVYSKSSLPGLQQPFLLDQNRAYNLPIASVNLSLGQELLQHVGSNITLEMRDNTDYAYYSGTSMASPHVAGAAALAWSNNSGCTAAQVRTALIKTAQDLETQGYDELTGLGLVQAKAASDYLAIGCNGGEEPITGVFDAGRVERGEWKHFTLDIPAGKTKARFSLSGSGGDVDIYVRQGAQPTLNAREWDCRPYLYGNNESCTFYTPSANTWHVSVNGYLASSDVKINYKVE